MVKEAKKFLQGLAAGILIVCGIIVAPVQGQAVEFTEADATILKSSTDPDEVAEVIYKLADLYDEKGKDALKSAVPGLIESARRELGLPEDERWNIYDILKVLSYTEDERVKPLLLYTMSSMGGGGNPFTAQGFLNIGHSTVSAIVDSLKSTAPESRGRAAVTLHKMSEFDESGTFFSADDKKKIRTALLKLLADENANVRIYTVIALRSFGDSSVITPLEQIERHDAHKDSGGTYEVRIEATETLKLLRGEK